MATKLTTAAKLRDEVLETLERVRDNPKYAMQAHEIGNLAGKVSGLCKLHLERCKINKTASTGDWDRFITGS